jgi:DNA sulfur modification protein DndC
VDTINELIPTERFSRKIDTTPLNNKLYSIISEIQEQYLEDSTPWVIAFSGGKDSTAVLQLIFIAISRLPIKQRSKEIHVLSNDTLVENPKVVEFLDRQLAKISGFGKSDLYSHNSRLFNVRKTTPKLDDTFWLNIIGKGYPSPNRWFRWCTERMRINPTNEYILQTVNKHGQAIIVLGTRKDESTNRANSMKQYEVSGVRLRKHSLPNAYVFAPIADITNEEVWQYLMNYPNPWKSNNQELVDLYYQAYDNLQECPLVIDTTTPSCGNSRFGCWVCTVVDKDRSMQGMITNGEDWMQPLLDIRNWLQEIRNNPEKREKQRRNKQDGIGPFTIDTRKEILERVLYAEISVAAMLGESHEFISLPELAAIQTQWNYDGHFEHNVREIYERVKGKKIMLDDKNSQDERRREEYKVLEQVCLEHGINPDHVKVLMELERKKFRFLRRNNLFGDMRTKVEEFVKEMER